MIRRLGLVTVLALLAPAAPAWAGIDIEHFGCQYTVGREGRTFFRTATYALLLCRDRIGAGVLDGGTDCATESATALRIGLAERRLERRLTQACSDAAVAALAFGGGCAGDEHGRWAYRVSHRHAHG